MEKAQGRPHKRSLGAELQLYFQRKNQGVSNTRDSTTSEKFKGVLLDRKILPKNTRRAEAKHWNQ